MSSETLKPLYLSIWREDELREEAGIGVKIKQQQTNKQMDPCYFDIEYSIKVILNINYYHIVTKMCGAAWLLLLNISKCE